MPYHSGILGSKNKLAFSWIFDCCAANCQDFMYNDLLRGKKQVVASVGEMIMEAVKYRARSAFELNKMRGLEYPCKQRCV